DHGGIVGRKWIFPVGHVHDGIDAHTGFVRRSFYFFRSVLIGSGGRLYNFEADILCELETVSDAELFRKHVHYQALFLGRASRLGELRPPARWTTRQQTIGPRLPPMSCRLDRDHKRWWRWISRKCGVKFWSLARLDKICGDSTRL